MGFDGWLNIITKQIVQKLIDERRNRRRHRGGNRYPERVWDLVERLEGRWLLSSGAAFGTEQNVPTGNSPHQVAVADLNGDGREDLVVTNSADNTVSVLLGNGDGTFQSQRTFATGAGPEAVTVADVNGDQLPDLIVTNFTDHTVGVLLGNGDGTFQTQTTYAVPDRSYNVAVAEINGDGKPDLVVSLFSGGSIISTLLGNGDGTFQAQTTLAVGLYSHFVATADLRGDGLTDIVSANWNTPSTVGVLLGNGDGTFENQQTYAVDNTPLVVMAADVNSDGIPDLITANNGGLDISVLLGIGDGRFQPQQTYAAGYAPSFAVVADVNDDGILDVVVADNYGGVSVLLGNGDGTFQSPLSFATSNYVGNVAVAEINGDNKPDIVLTDESSGTANTAGILLGGISQVSLSTSSNPVEADSPVTLTATVAPAGTGTTPTGQVTFFDGSTALGSPVALSGGMATLTTSSLTIGTHDITASYAGDITYDASASGALSQTVSLADTMTNLAASTATAIGGAAVTLTATVVPVTTSGATPTGTVTFFQGGAILATAPVLSNGTAVYTTTFLPTGSYSFKASYGGDATFVASMSSVVAPFLSGCALSVLHNFDIVTGGTDGGVIMDAAGNLYGTEGGSDTNDGSVFEIPRSTGVITTLASFNGTNGAEPIARLFMDGVGDLYGITASGGANNDGTVFEVAIGASVITTLASFNTTDGAGLVAGLTADSAGNLYGTTFAGGADNDGTVFEVAQGSGVITTLASAGPTDASVPFAELIVDTAGNLYGTSEQGGVNQNGSVFELASGSSTFTVLASFDGNDGSFPDGGLVMDSAGNLYGTTTNGSGSDGNGNGVVFELVQGSGVITPLATFDGTDGGDTEATLIMDSAGNLFGTSPSGGDGNGSDAHGDGTIFEVAQGSGAITTLAAFNGNNGSLPDGALSMDSLGDIYGTTGFGGANTVGTIFELSPPPTQLAFIAPPSTAVAGATIEPAVTVGVENATGNLVAADNSTVMLSIASGPPGATLGGTISAMTINGVATFANLSLNEAGAYTLQATDGTLTAATSIGFNITPAPVAPAAQLAFATPPSAAFVGAIINPAVTVSVEDANGNVAVADNSTVTLAIVSGPPGAALGGTFSVTAVNGVATFANLSLNEAGSYTLQATDGTLTGVTSTGFNITPPPAQLAFGAPPAAAIVGATLSPAVTVNVEDAGGNFVVNDNSTVTLAITSGPAGAALGGTVSAAAVNGVATFANLSLNQAGAYTLTATDGTLTFVTSAGFFIAAPGTLPPAKLAFTALPAAAIAGATLSPAVTVSVQDTGGNVVASDSSTVTLTLASGPAGAILGGTLSATAVNGVASFANLALTLAGAYTLTATDGTLNSATSMGITVFPPAQIGTLDPTFGVGGLASHNVGLTSTAGLAVQSDGKSIIAGTVTTTGAGALSVTRYNADGSGDTSFGIASSAGSLAFGITRYNADGSLDTSFGTNGVTITPLPGNAQAEAEVLLANGDFLVAGTDTFLVNGQSDGSQFAVAEYTSAGTLDTTFGNGAGYVLTSFASTAGTLSNDSAHALAVGSDGAIYVGGSSDAAGHGLNFAIAAYTPSGSPSPGFGTNGKLLLDFSGGNDSIAALALGAGGILIAAGSAMNASSGISDVALAEFLPGGALNTKFGAQGRLVTSVGSVDDAASTLAIDAKGRIVVGGFTAVGSASAGTLSANFLLLRYASTGKLDKTFGARGVVTTSFNQPAAVTNVLIDADGTIVASGKTVASLATFSVSDLNVAVARYTAKGQLDTTFHGTGQGIFSLAGAIAPQSLTTPGGHAAQPAFLHSAALIPFDATSDLMSALMQLTQSDQGVIAASTGGELLDVGNNGVTTVEASIVSMGLDLAATLVASLPPSIVAGAKGTASVIIAEDGTALAAGTFTVELFASSSPYLAATQLPFQSFSENLKLKQGVSKSLRLKFLYPSLSKGNYYLVTMVSTGKARDLNMANNTSPSTSSVVIAPAFVQLSGGSLTAPTFDGPKPASVSFTITNSGNETASAISAVQFFASTTGTPTGAISLATTPLKLSLKSGAAHAYKVKLALPTMFPAGTYMLVALLDPANVFDDTNAAMNFIVSGNTFVVS